MYGPAIQKLKRWAVLAVKNFSVVEPNDRRPFRNNDVVLIAPPPTTALGNVAPQIEVEGILRVVLNAKNITAEQVERDPITIVLSPPLLPKTVPWVIETIPEASHEAGRTGPKADLEAGLEAVIEAGPEADLEVVTEASPEAIPEADLEAVPEADP